MSDQSTIKARIERGSVFVSYRRVDLAIVKRIVTRLRDRGVVITWDQDDLAAGDDWNREVNAIIDRSSFFLVFFSAGYETAPSTAFMDEVRRAASLHALKSSNGNPWILPVKLSPCDIPPVALSNGKLLSSLHWITLDDDTLGERVAEIDEIVSHLPRQKAREQWKAYAVELRKLRFKVPALRLEVAQSMGSGFGKSDPASDQLRQSSLMSASRRLAETEEKLRQAEAIFQDALWQYGTRYQDDWMPWPEIDADPDYAHLRGDPDEAARKASAQGCLGTAGVLLAVFLLPALGWVGAMKLLPLG